MTQTIPLTAELKDRAGKGAARATRRAGRIPAVIYGGKEPSVMITLDRMVFERQYTGTFFTHIFELNVGGTVHRAIPRDVQLDPVSDRPLHVDFQRVTGDTEIHVKVPVVFAGQDKSPGLKKGGVLNVVRHELDLVCKADSIPEHVTVDVSAFDVGTSIHISAVTLPEGTRSAITDRDFTIATIAAPSAMKSDAAATGDAGAA